MNSISKTLLTLLSVLIVGQASARFAGGGLIGGNFSALRTGLDVNGVHSNAQGMYGYQIGGALRYEEPEWAVEVDGIWTNRTFKLDNGTNSQTDTLTQLEVPFIGYYVMPRDRVTYRFGLGLVGTYGLGKIKEKDEDNSGNSTTYNYDWKTFGFNRFNVGGLIALGSDYTISGDLRLGLELRGQAIFTDMTSSGSRFSGDKANIMNLDLIARLMF